MIVVQPRNPTSKMAKYGIEDFESWRQRQIVVLLATLGLWDLTQIARAYGTTRHSVIRARRHFQVEEVSTKDA